MSTTTAPTPSGTVGMTVRYALLSTRTAYRNVRFLVLTVALPLLLFLLYANLYQGQDTDTRDSENEQDADVNVGNHTPVRCKRNYGHHDECGSHSNVRRHKKDPAIGLVRNEIFFCEELDRVGNRLQQSPGADAHRSKPRLHERRNLPFEVGCVSHPAGNDRHYSADLNKRPDDVVDCCWAEELQQQFVYEVDRREDG